jgi:hypothetical protein
MGDSLNKAASSEVIKLAFPGDYAFLSDQGLVPKDEREQKAGAFIKFKDKELLRLWEEVERKKLAADSYDLYGTFFAALRKRFEQFTSRDVRNVTMNASARLFSFDFPQEWLTQRDMFIARDYDTRKKMILEAALAYQKGLTVGQVLFQEMVHYVETTIAMLDSGRQYRIRQLAQDPETVLGQGVALVGHRTKLLQGGRVVAPVIRSDSVLVRGRSIREVIPFIGLMICRHNERSKTDDNDKDERSDGCFERHSHPSLID